MHFIRLLKKVEVVWQQTVFYYLFGQILYTAGLTNFYKDNVRYLGKRFFFNFALDILLIQGVKIPALCSFCIFEDFIIRLSPVLENHYRQRTSIQINLNDSSCHL